MKTETKKLNDGQILFLEGDTSEGLYFIQEGIIEIYRIKDGEEIVLSVMETGGLVGTMTMISKSPRTASARAVGQCVLTFFANDGLMESFQHIPVWAQAVIKETVAIIKDLDEKLMNAKLKERTLLRQVGTIFHHTAQVANLLASFMRNSTIKDDLNIPIYVVKDFLIRAEFILLKKYTYLEKIYNAFIENGLIKPVQSQKYGLNIVRPRPDLLEEFANFSTEVARKGTDSFIPMKSYKWITALLRISKRYNNLEKFGKDQLSGFLKEELMRNDIPEIITLLLKYNLINQDGTLYRFSPVKIQKIMVFEGIIKSINDQKY